MALKIYTPPTFEKVTYEIPDELLQFVEDYVAYAKEVHGQQTSIDRVTEMMCESVVDSARKSMRAFRAHLTHKESSDGKIPKIENKKLPKPNRKDGNSLRGHKENRAIGEV